jgi:hypothetical protein
MGIDRHLCGYSIVKAGSRHALEATAAPVEQDAKPHSATQPDMPVE